jgi:hypothetical protein
MPRQTKTSTPADTTAERLKNFYTWSSRASRSELSRMSRRLFALADAAGLPNVRATAYNERHTIYTRAAEAGFGASPEADRLRAQLARFEAEQAPQQQTSPPVATSRKKEPRLWNVAMTNTCECVGFVQGEIVQATEADDLRVGEIAALKHKGGKTITVGRLTAISDTSVTVLSYDEQDTASRADLEFLGRVNPEPIGRSDGPDKAAQARLAQLRKRLDGVNIDDITNSTVAMKIEREIYDIEHPPKLND